MRLSDSASSTDIITEMKRLKKMFDGGTNKEKKDKSRLNLSSMRSCEM